MLQSAIRSSVLLALGSVSVFAAASDFSITPPLNQPIGVVYSPVVNKLLFSQPFCGITNRQIIAVSDTGQATLFATLPDRVPTSVHADCWEDYIAVSPGLGGFNPGDVFVAQGQNIRRIPPGGGPSTLFTTISALTDTHTGITFDKVGTFGYQMLITGQNGLVYSVNSSGVVTPLADTIGASLPGEVGVENGAVAPLTWGPLGGYFIIPAEDRGKIFAVSPNGTPSQHPVSVVAENYGQPEVVHFVPQILQNWGASGGVFFDIIFDYDNTKVVKFPASDFTAAMKDQAFIPQEDDGTIGLIYGGSPVVKAPFTSGLGQQEGSTFVTQANGCTLTIGGYKNQFNSLVISLTIGGVVYTPAQLTQILNQPAQGNGAVTLAQQLIAAKLNVYYGASLSPSVSTAMTAADNLLASVTSLANPTNKVPPVGTAYLAPGSTSSYTTVLDNFNNGLLGPLHCQ